MAQTYTPDQKRRRAELAKQRRLANLEKYREIGRECYHKNKQKHQTPEDKARRYVNERAYKQRNPHIAKNARRKYKLKNPAAQREYQQKARQWVNAFKLQRGCIDCGYHAHPAALHCDHVSGDKHFEIGDVSNLERIKEEIEKCVVRCANCHAVKTWPHLTPIRTVDETQRQAQLSYYPDCPL